MLGALICSLAACAYVMPVKDFDLDRMAGKWFMVGFATNAKWFTSSKDVLKMGTSIMTPTAEGDLHFSFANLREFGCWNFAHYANKTDIPGRFIYHSETVWQNENDIRVVDIVYDDYVVIHTIKTKDGMTEVLNNLYTRSPEPNATLQQKFTQFSLETGVLPENIVLMEKNEECPHN